MNRDRDLLNKVCAILRAEASHGFNAGLCPTSSLLALPANAYFAAHI